MRATRLAVFFMAGLLAQGLAQAAAPNRAVLNPGPIDLVLEAKPSGLGFRVRRGGRVRVTQQKLSLFGKPHKITVYSSPIDGKVLGIKTVGAEAVCFYSGIRLKRSDLQLALQASLRKGAGQRQSADPDLELFRADGRLRIDTRAQRVRYTYAARSWRDLRDPTSLEEGIKWINKDARYLDVPVRHLSPAERPARDTAIPAAKVRGAAKSARRAIRVDRGLGGIEELSPLEFRALFGAKYVDTVQLAAPLTLRHLWDFAGPRLKRARDPHSLQFAPSTPLDQVGSSTWDARRLASSVAKKIRSVERWVPWQARALYAPLIRAGAVGPVFIKEVPELRGEKGMSWGLYAAKDIPVGGFIGAYTGELIPDDKSRTDRSYFLGGQGREVLDAKRMGNETRFVNHSSKRANAKLGSVEVDSLVRPFLFAARPIKAGEQILFDYGPGYWRGVGVEPKDL